MHTLLRRLCASLLAVLALLPLSPTFAQALTYDSPTFSGGTYDPGGGPP